MITTLCVHFTPCPGGKHNIKLVDCEQTSGFLKVNDPLVQNGQGETRLELKSTNVVK